MAPIDKLLSEISAGQGPNVVLVVGDLVLAEPAGQRVAAALAKAAGCTVDLKRRPLGLQPVLADLRTFSLFASGKVVLVVDSAVLADRNSAASLIDDAGDALPLSQKGGGLSGNSRESASRLLQALRLFGVDPFAGAPAAAIEQLPAWAFQGGVAYRKRRQNKPRPKGEVETLRAGLVDLLAAARAEELVGAAEGDLTELGAAIEVGLPPGHSLVLVESAAAEDHPLARTLAERGALISAGRLEAEKGGGWQGLDRITDELESQTGIGIASDAVAELARRTLRQGEQHADSTARFAGEYRKLAELAKAEKLKRITLAVVEGSVEDRGEEDVWQLLDAISSGRGDQALERIGRLLRSAEDPLAARLSFFSLLAGFCRQLVAVGGLLTERGLPRGEANYSKFKSKLAVDLQTELPGGRKNPIGGLHPFRLHRVYLAASRIPVEALGELPWRVLETELRIKGESGDPDVALADLIARVAGAGRAPARAARR
ncbi:MAG: hypothetical protein ABI609_03185 [Acidobacteriota bacterium]